MASVRACYMTGCGSSNIMGEYFFDIKSSGTMTHSYIQSFGMGKDSEYKAFDTYIKTLKGELAPLIMLLDTYNTLESGIVNAIDAFKNNGIDDSYKGIYGIRIDSGNLLELSKKCRKILKENGFNNAKIILTGGLDEEKIKWLMENKAEVDIFGVGDAISIPKKIFTTVYKMSKSDEQDVMKISDEEQKTSYPGDKNLYRKYGNNRITDIITLSGEREEEELQKDPLVRRLTMDFIVNGKKLEKNVKLLELEESRKYYEKNIEKFSAYSTENFILNKDFSSVDVCPSKELEKLVSKLKK